jgi:SagB-type dehydrogenase family enzyme
MSKLLTSTRVEYDEIDLPAPEIRHGMPLVEALAHRRSHREFAAGKPELAQVGQLCWAGQGITEGRQGFRTAPSAGAIQPIALMVVDADGVYRYEPSAHRLRRLVSGDVRQALQSAAGDQTCVGEAPVCFIVAADIPVIAAKYGRRRGSRYALLEAGHVAQNLLLQATALGLAGVPVGAYDDRQVADVLGLPRELRALYLVPLGFPAVG